MAEGIDVALARAAEAAAHARVLAHRTRGIAEAARRLAWRAEVAAGTPWRSPAADLFRSRTGELSAALADLAAEVDDTADVLLRHAATAGERAEHLAALNRAVELATAAGVEDAVRAASRALDRALPGPLRVT